MTLPEIAAHLVLFLVFAAFVAGLIDAIAGGGGLITVPALLLAGASPVEALATNKLQGTFGAATATLSYARAGHVPADPRAAVEVFTTAPLPLRTGALRLSGEWRVLAGWPGRLALPTAQRARH